MLRVIRVIASIVFVATVLVTAAVGGVVGVTLWHFSQDLPDYQQIANYVPATGSKVYASDGKLMAQLEGEHRIPVQISQVPRPVIQAFLAAEDRDFYTHNGVNPGAIIRAALADVTRMHRGQRPMGASTITQQVVRHFLLTNEVSVARKVKEALLAYRIEKTLSKDRILEIYLNDIYLGAGAYGVSAAADIYFQKPLDKLTLPEIAFLAALPKAPNNYNPFRHPEAAKGRRDWVLTGMAEIGAITQAQAKEAALQPLGVHLRTGPIGGPTSYFAEEVRRELIARFGEKALYEGGLSIRTSLNQSYQQMAEAAFRQGLVDYDRRHGWRGALAHQPTSQAAQAALLTMADPPGIAPWQLAAVTEIDGSGATVAVKGGMTGRISLEEMRWARRTVTDQRLGNAVRGPRDVVEPGDIVLVEALSGKVAAAPVATSAPSGKPAKGARTAPSPQPTVQAYGLRQLPDVSGAFVAMDPHTGRVYAMVGGWSFQQSQFNRAIQAKRQPGSAFKPFVYVTALENGFTPQTTIEDSPIEIPQGPGLPPWKPGNYEGDYVGTTTLEEALVHSRNLATARLATQVGLAPIAKKVQEMDVMDKMPLYYSMTLGAGETTLLRLTNAYAMLDNGGHWLLPSVIDTVQDRDGRILYQKGVGGCAACYVAAGAHDGSDSSALYKASGTPGTSPIAGAGYADRPVLYKPTKRDPLLDPTADAEIVAMMQGVVQRGTGTEVAKVGKPIAGKTGTTSDWFDAWFVGFSPDLAAGVYVGFDDPRTLGDGEVGGHVAAPIFRDFMMAALKDKPATPFPLPPGANPLVASNTNPDGVKGKSKLASLDPNDPDADNASTDPNNPAGPPMLNGGKVVSSYPFPGSTDDNATMVPSPRSRDGYASAQPPADVNSGWTPTYAMPQAYNNGSQWPPNAPPPATYAPPQSAYAAPAYAAPNYNAPGYNTPGYNTPSYNAPSYNPPGYAAPGYAAPGSYGVPDQGYSGYGSSGYPAGSYGAPTRGRPMAGTGGYY